MTFETLLHGALGSALALGLAAAFSAALSRPAARHRVWAAGVAAALLVPVLDRLPDRMSMPAALNASESGTGIILLLWGAGAVLVLVLVARDLRRLRRETRAGRPLRSGRRVRSLREAARRVGLRRPPRLVEGSPGESPRTWGLLRPVLIVPPESAGWSDARLRIVLLHELHHLRRRDWAIQLLSSLACALYWFNPLAWVAADRLRRERERACDEAVVRAGVAPADYAEALLGLARDLVPRRSLAPLLAPRRSGLERRLHRILYDSPMGPPRRVPVVATVTATLLSAAVWGSMGLDGPAAGSGTRAAAPRAAAIPVAVPLAAVPLGPPPVQLVLREDECPESRNEADRLILAAGDWADPGKRSSFLERVAEIRASREQRRVFEAVLARTDLDERDRAAAVESAGMMDRSAELADFLVHLARRESPRGEIRGAYLNAAARIDRDRDRARALAALGPDTGRA